MSEKDEEEKENIEEEEIKSEEDIALEDTLVAAIRAPQRGDLEQILASNLAAAVFAQPLDKIRMVLEAFMLLPEEEQQVVATGEEEIQYIKGLYEVAVSLSNIIELEPPLQHMRGRYASVPWSFSITQADKYLGLFVNRIWEFAQTEEWTEFFKQVKAADKNTEEGKELWNSYLREFAGFLCSGLASLSVVQQVKSEYIIKTMPYASQLLREIFKRYISKETWETMLSVIGGEKTKPKGGTSQL
jgi:hypothetical protein